MSALISTCSSDCVEDSDKLLIELSNFAYTFSSSHPPAASCALTPSVSASLVQFDSCLPGFESFSQLPKDNAAVYVAGFVLSRFKDQLCPLCCASFLLTSLPADPRYQFLAQKQYEGCGAGLTIPSIAFVTFLEKLYSHVNSHIADVVHLDQISERLLTKFHQRVEFLDVAQHIQSTHSTQPAADCCIALLNSMCKLFIRTKTHHIDDLWMNSVAMSVPKIGNYLN